MFQHLPRITSPTAPVPAPGPRRSADGESIEQPALTGCFVVGTGAGAGATGVAAGLHHWLQAAGFTAEVLGPRRAIRVANARGSDGRIEAVIVDGVGGLCHSLGPIGDCGDLAHDLGLPVLLVVGLGKDCVNHALLTAEVILARGLPLLGSIANSNSACLEHRSNLVSTLNREMLQRFEAPLLGVIPRLAVPSPAALAAHFDDAELELALATMGFSMQRQRQQRRRKSADQKVLSYD